jgi:DNA-binding response OmpR family regulator
MKTRNKVLLVDDEAAIRKILGIKLRVSGYDVVAAPDGEKALELIDSAKPDLVLLDVLMPGIDGFQVLERLRARSNLPVIVFSARPENAKHALNLGANDYIDKPFDVDEVVKIVFRILRVRK